MLKHLFKNKQWVRKSRQLLFINSPYILFNLFYFFPSFLRNQNLTAARPDMVTMGDG